MFAIGSKVRVIPEPRDYDSDAENVQHYVGVVEEVRDRGDRSSTCCRWYDPTTGTVARTRWWVPDRFLEVYRPQVEVGDTIFVPEGWTTTGQDAHRVRGARGVVTTVEPHLIRADWTGGESGDRRGWWVEPAAVLAARRQEPPSVERIRDYFIRLAPSKGWTREWVNEHFAAMGLDPWDDEATVTVTVRVGGATGIRAEDLVVTTDQGTVRSVTLA